MSLRGRRPCSLSRHTLQRGAVQPCRPALQPEQNWIEPRRNLNRHLERGVITLVSGRVVQPRRGRGRCIKAASNRGQQRRGARSRGESEAWPSCRVAPGRREGRQGGAPPQRPPPQDGQGGTGVSTGGTVRRRRKNKPLGAERRRQHARPGEGGRPCSQGRATALGPPLSEPGHGFKLFGVRC